MAFRWIQSTKCQYILESCCVCYDMLMPQWVGDVLPYTTQKWDVNGPGGIFHQSSPRENESYSIFFEGKTKKTTITLKKKKGSNFLQEIVLVLAIFQFASFQSCKQWKKKERKRQREREGGREREVFIIQCSGRPFVLCFSYCWKHHSVSAIVGNPWLKWGWDKM